MWWLLISLLPAVTLVLLSCGNDRQTPQRKKPTSSEKSRKSLKASSQSKKASRSTKGSKGGKSSKSVRSKKGKSSKAGKSGKSSKSGKASKSGESGKSTRSTRSAKSGRSGRSAKSSRKSTKSAKSFSKSRLAKPVSIKEEPAVIEKPVVRKNESGPMKDVFAEPPAVYFRSIGGLDKFCLVNDTNERRAFKVKCSDNQLYRFCPTTGFVPPHGITVIEVVRQNGTVKPDKVVVLSTGVAPGTVSGAKAIMAGTPSTKCQMMVVPLMVDA